MLVVLNNFEDAWMFLSEAIENGYEYRKCVHEVSMRFNLDNNRTEKVLELMNNFDREKDEDYFLFKTDLRYAFGNEKVEWMDASIREITKAINLVMNCRGMEYGSAMKIVNELIRERRRLEKMLKEIEII